MELVDGVHEYIEFTLAFLFILPIRLKICECFFLYHKQKCGRLKNWTHFRGLRSSMQFFHACIRITLQTTKNILKYFLTCQISCHNH